MGNHKGCRASRRVIIVGGDGRLAGLTFEAASVRLFRGRRSGGNGSLANVRAAIGGGDVDLVLILVRWVGHPQSRAVVRACSAAGVPYKGVRGGRSALLRALRAHFGGC